MKRKDKKIYVDEYYKTLQKTYSLGRHIVGYCHYHHRFVTAQQAELHGCFEKKCRRLEWVK